MNHIERCMIEFENCLWNANEILSMVEHAGSYSSRLSKIRNELEALASDVREYNDSQEEIE